MILENKKLKYNTARERILDAILSGSLEKDLMLPSEQKLASRLGIGRNTLRTALRELEREGIIVKQNGRPSQVNSDALKKKKSPLRRIAWVDTTPIGQTNPIYFDIFRSLSEGAALRNVKIDYISLTLEAMAENFFRRQHEYDGLILGEITPDFRHSLPLFTHENRICVDCSRAGVAHCVKTDSRLGGQLAARALIESGHRRPVFLGFSDAIRIYEPFGERFRGFKEALVRAGISLAPKNILLLSSVEEEDHFPEFLKKNLPILKKADSIFAVSDSLAVSALSELPKMGFSIPDDISLIGFDGMTLSRFVSPALTTIRQPVEEIGRKALEIVLNPAESKSYPAVIQIPPVLLHGDSLRNRREKEKEL